MGVTKERVRQIEARALNKLRQAAAGRAHRAAGLNVSARPDSRTRCRAALRPA